LAGAGPALPGDSASAVSPVAVLVLPGGASFELLAGLVWWRDEAPYREEDGQAAFKMLLSFSHLALHLWISLRKAGFSTT